MRSSRGVTNLLCWLSVTLSLAAAGCLSSDPDRTAGRAIDAARNGKLSDFRSQLTDNARRTLGTQQQMDAIRQKLAHSTNVSVGEATLIGSGQSDRGAGRIADVRRTYEAIVIGAPKKGAPIQAIYRLFLKCLISYNVYHHDAVSDTCTTTIDANGIPWTNCVGASPAYDSLDLGESCLISGIEEAQAASTE
ncbi:MAG TPA: hypothetical protein VNN08_17000 [Thermoanaerobaculia bacterium]|nr:hypothetical protein [Thermoanaerobaculia bacterium]